MPNRSSVRRPARRAVAGLALAALAALALGGCVAADGRAPRADVESRTGAPSEAELRQAARSAMGGKGHVDVRLVDGVAFVSGEVETAIDESAVLRAIERFDGVERVENGLRREM